MGLVNMNDVLIQADRERYAVGAFNVINLEFLEAILDAAIAKKSPVVLSVAEVHFKYVTLDNIAPLISELAQRAPVPVVIHLDHGESFETVMRAIRCGFTSVMFDGSTLPFEENIAKTREVVKAAHACGVSVEAELGQVMGSEGGTGGYTGAVDVSAFTRPEDAAEFVARTKVDNLAVAIGSAHGRYSQPPKLDFDRLTAIKRATGIPLSLHGGTGIAPQDFKTAIQLGITKVNIYTAMAQRATEIVRERLEADPETVNLPGVLKYAKGGVTEVVMEHMDIFGSSGICDAHNALCAVCNSCDNCKIPAEKTGAPTLQGMDQEEMIRLITQIVTGVLREIG